MNDKKWFVYLGDHHEGPFSLSEIQIKMSEGKVTTQNFVWCEGMGDWQLMAEVESFKPLLDGSGAGIGSPPSTFDLSSPTIDRLNHEFTKISENVSHESTRVSVATEHQKEPSLLLTPAPSSSEADLLIAPMESGELKQEPAQSRKKKSSFAAVLYLIIFIPLLLIALDTGGYLDFLMRFPVYKAASDAVSDAMRPTLMKLVQVAPPLGRWISPIPRLDDVSPEDYEDLKSAAQPTPADGAGMIPKISMAVSRADLGVPTFYISTNLPDGVQLQMILVGQGDTLLNETSFTGQSSGSVVKSLAKTGSIRHADGRPLVRGDYMAYVMEADEQKPEVSQVLANLPASVVKIPDELPRGKKAIAKKSFFLGGPKDASYTARLKEFHEKLLAKAQAELTETKQFYSTLETQLLQTVEGFNRIKRSSQIGAKKGKKSPPKGLAKSQIKAWNELHTKWIDLDGQLIATMQKWTPEALQNEYFYGTLYSLVLQAEQSVSRVHQLQHSFFVGSVDEKSFDIQLGEASGQAQNALTALKTKIDQAESIPPTPNGMPRKDGI